MLVYQGALSKCRLIMKKFCQILFVFFSWTSLWAQGNLLLHPQRLVFSNPQDRVQTISLTNTGSDTTTYRISFSQIRMKPNGKMQEINEPDPGQNFADPYLRLFPKTITIAPNKSQLVKLQLIKSGDLEEGEYRSHLVFRALPKNNEPSTSSNSVKKDEFNIQIKPVFGYGIPVIIQKGNPAIDVNLSDIKLFEKASDKYLSFLINRKGSFSPYGDIKIIHTSSKSHDTEIALRKGIAVYTPLNSRELEFKLKVPQELDLSDGHLKIIYSVNASSQIYDEKILVL